MDDDQGVTSRSEIIDLVSRYTRTGDHWGVYRDRYVRSGGEWRFS